MSLDIDRRDGGSLKGSSYAKPAPAFKLFHDVRLFLIPLLFIASLLLGGFANAPQPEGVNSYLVTRVIDGDTIQLAGGERVRYIGIDTPETVHPSKPVEHFGKEASAANRKLVEGKQVRLELDVEERDRYGRMLAYVYQGETFVNAWLVEQGYARVSTYPPNVKYQELFTRLERAAREDNRGLWGRK